MYSRAAIRWNPNFPASILSVLKFNHDIQRYCTTVWLSPDIGSIDYTKEAIVDFTLLRSDTLLSVKREMLIIGDALLEKDFLYLFGSFSTIRSWFRVIVEDNVDDETRW